MMRKAILAGALLLSATVAAPGCAGTVTYGTSASLAYVGPGVWVVEDYRYPVFYSTGYYWWYIDGYWYRSVSLHDHYVRVRADVVPTRVRRVDNPRRYRRYHAPANVRRRHIDRDRERERRRNVREHQERRRVEPGHRNERRATPPGHRKPYDDNRGRRATPPGHGGTPPGHGGTPPGRGRGSPGHGRSGDHGRGHGR